MSLMRRNLAAILLLTLAGAAGAEDLVTVLDADGRELKGPLQGWTKSAIVLKDPLPVEQVVSIDFGRLADPLKVGAAALTFANGDTWLARPIEMADETLKVGWERYTPWPVQDVPLETLSSLILDLPAPGTARRNLWRDLEMRSGGADLVVLSNGERTADQLLSLDGAFVEIDRSGNPIKLDRRRVRAIGLDPDLSSFPATTGPRLVFRLRDGSRVTAIAAEQVEGDGLRLRLPWQADLTVPLGEICRCDIFSSRVQPLAERQPTSVVHTPFLSSRWPLVVNRNVWRGPLRIRNREFATGLGMHSQTVARFAVQQGDREFRAIVGLDDEAAPRGSVRFRIAVDDRDVWTSPELTSQSPALHVPPVPLTGAGELKLIVDFGEQADVSDYADWCDAVILRDPR